MLRHATYRLARRATARAEVAYMVNNCRNVVAIHYSCEGFYDATNPSSPRVTAIAVRNLFTGQTTSFSIHQMAERDHVDFESIYEQYDSLEKKMLREFYEFVDKHRETIWLHWNMRDATYGFQALAHRYRVLGGDPVDIHESNLRDLSRILTSLYGYNYIEDPRMVKLVVKNDIHHKDFLTGKQEAEAFENREYLKQYRSTIVKVGIICHILDRVASGTLRTNAAFHDIYGGYVGYALELMREHWLIALIGVIGSITSIIGLLIVL